MNILEAGLYGGNFSLGHLFNRIYRLSWLFGISGIIVRFLCRGLSHANYTDKKTGYRLWYTGINGVYGVHYGLLGGPPESAWHFWRRFPKKNPVGMNRYYCHRLCSL